MPTQKLEKEIEKINSRLAIIENFLVEKYAIEYGNPDYDETIPFKSIPDTNGVYQFNIQDISLDANFHTLEVDERACYCWSGYDPVVKVKLPVSTLSKKTTVQIGFIAIIKKKYIRSLKLEINTNQVSHRVRRINERNYLIADFDCGKLDIISELELKIILPATHSPKEIGKSEDTRKLGIALSDFCLIPTPTYRQRIKSKFGIK